jgi:hypothetical protein
MSVPERGKKIWQSEHFFVLYIKSDDWLSIGFHQPQGRGQFAPLAGIATV